MKGLFIFANNMEDVEGLATRALLIRSGIEITTTSFSNEKTLVTKFNQTIETDTLIKDVNPEEYDFLIIPGGPYVAEHVDRDTNVKRLAQRFYDQNKLIAAICAGPRFLGQIGLLDGKNYTAFTGSDIDAPNGRYHPERKALKDGNIITARGAGAVYEFVYEIIKTLQDEKQADALLAQILY